MSVLVVIQILRVETLANILDMGENTYSVTLLQMDNIRYIIIDNNIFPYSL